MFGRVQHHRTSTTARRALLALAVIVALGGGLMPSTVAMANTTPRLTAAGPHGLVPPRGTAKPGGGGGSPLLVWHGGEIMTSSSVKAIFWGTSWANATYQGDKLTGLDSLYSGLGNTSYMGTNTEYTGTNGQVGASVTYQGHVVDTSAAPTHAPKTTTILAEVERVVTNPVANGYYPVYTDLKRGHAGYCAWHSYGTINGVPVQFAFFFDLDGDPGCDPGSPSAYGHSQGLAALANVSGHEISEAVTDPRNGGWYDGTGAENADKCAWNFNPAGGVIIGGQSWKIQGNYSNAAQGTNSGYDGAGCIDR